MAVGHLSVPMKVRPDIGATVAARLADEWLFDIDGGELVIPLIKNLAEALPKLAVSTDLLKLP